MSEGLGLEYSILTYTHLSIYMPLFQRGFRVRVRISGNWYEQASGSECLARNFNRLTLL